MDLKKFTNLESNRKRAILLLRFESLLITGIVVYLLIAPLISSVSLPKALGAEIIYGLLVAAGLLVSALGFKQKRPYGRAPAVLANLIALGVSYYMVMGSFLYVGIPLMLLSIVTILSAALGYKE
jgi:hypothetical protein